MPDGYGTQHEYVERVRANADARQEAIEAALRDVFSRFIHTREVEVVVFSSMSALDLATAISAEPMILKPLLAACNIAARAVERDLEIRNLDTYTPRLGPGQAELVAGYIKPFLPAHLEIPTLSQLGRVAYIDKEVRKGKGRWEKRILQALNQHGRGLYHKRMFEADGQQFEIDAATPTEGDIEIGVDVKRIEARRDIHKRCDEIVNKSSKLKSAFPRAKFGVVVYYPFVEEHANVHNRLRSTDVDSVVFASDAGDSIENAVRLLLSALRVGAT